MKKFFVVAVAVLLSASASVSFAGDNYKDSRGVNRRVGVVQNNQKPVKTPANYKGTIDLEAVSQALKAQNKKTEYKPENDWAIRHDPGSVASVYGNQAQYNHAPSGFKPKQEPKPKPRSKKAHGSYKNIYNQFDENGKKISSGVWN